MEDKKIFVSYSWNNDSPDQKVMQFVAKLRLDGYNAEFDVMKSQERTSINFVEMMSKSLAEAQKVIIVLSQSYKKKADSFQSGVGEEYRYIISDISKNENKYILVTFEREIASVQPDFLATREVIKINTSNNDGWNKLLHKINDTHEYQLPDVNPHKRYPQTIHISGDSIDQPMNNTSPIYSIKGFPEYYNLLVSAGEDAWEDDSYIMTFDRCLTSYTSPEIRTKYDIQKEETINIIKKFPCIFAYENYLQKSSYIGYITEMKVRSSGIKFDFIKVDTIDYEQLNKRTFDLDIDMSKGYTELGHSHWTIKKVNLYKEFPSLRSHIRV